MKCYNSNNMGQVLIYSKNQQCKFMVLKFYLVIELIPYKCYKALSVTNEGKVSYSR